MSTLRLATRRSPLALAQAQAVGARLGAIGVDWELVPVDTMGDRRTDVALSAVGGQGVFAVEVQRCVLDGDADIAVHSAKDLPSITPVGLVLVSVPERRDAADALVGKSLAGLGPGATVATGSPRRRALLLERRPDLNVVELRGNMATRVSAAGRDGVDAVIAAVAALSRLDWMDRISERLDPTWFVPQVGQGSLALEARIDDHATRQALSAINDSTAFELLSAERAFLRELGAGCSIPAGAHASTQGGRWQLRGVMAAPDGSVVVRDSLEGDDAEALGTQLARRLRDELGGGSLEGWRT